MAQSQNSVSAMAPFRMVTHARGVPSGCNPSDLSRGYLRLIILLFPGPVCHLVVITTLQATIVIPKSLCLPYMEGRSSSAGLVPPDDMVNFQSVVGVTLVPLV